MTNFTLKIQNGRLAAILIIKKKKIEQTILK